MGKDVIARGQMTVAALKDGATGPQGPKGDKGDPGANGADGKDAVVITAVPGTIVIDTDEKGVATGLSTATAQLSCKRGGTAVKVSLWRAILPQNCSVKGQTTPDGGFLVTITAVEAQDTTVDGETVTVSKTSGSVMVQAVVEGVGYSKTLPFTVNMARYTGGLQADNKALKSQYTELSNDLQGDNPTVLAKYTSTIKQTAREISLSVSEDDKQALLATGVDISNKKVTVTADNFEVKNNSGTTSFMVDGNGKLNTALIDADAIEVKHLWAKSEDGQTKVGYVGNAEDAACKVDDKTYAPLFLGADTATKSSFYVSTDGYLVTKKATLGSFTLGMNDLRYDAGYEGEDAGMMLYNDYILFRNYKRTYNSSTGKTESERNRMVWVGKLDFPPLDYSKRSNIFVEDSEEKSYVSSIGLYVSVEGSDDSLQNNILYQDELYGNFAIYADKGMTAGLRPAIRRIDRSMTLTACDHTLVCINQSEITLTLPSAPQRGQCYVIIQRGVKVNVKSPKKDMFSKGSSSAVSTWYSNTYMQETHVVFDGTEWNITYFT